MTDIWILLFLEQSLGIGLIGLGHLDDKRASRVELACCDKIFFGLMDFHSAKHKDVKHPQGCRVVALFAGDDEGKGLAFFSYFDRIFIHPVKVVQEIFFVKISCFYQAKRKGEFVVHQVS